MRTSPTGGAARRGRAARTCRPRRAAEAARLEAQFTDEELERLIRAKGARRALDAVPASRLMYARAAVVGAPRTRAECVLSRLRGRAGAPARRCSGASATSGSNGRSRRSSAAVKGLLFDCRMCGQCVLSSTGMSCPMNCPKSLRNGPCGGVRADGNCEVKPRDALRLGRGLSRAAERIPGGVAAMRKVQIAGRPARCRAAPPGCAWHPRAGAASAP